MTTKATKTANENQKVQQKRNQQWDSYLSSDHNVKWSCGTWPYSLNVDDFDKLTRIATAQKEADSSIQAHYFRLHEDDLRSLGFHRSPPEGLVEDMPHIVCVVGGQPKLLWDMSKYIPVGVTDSKGGDLNLVFADIMWELSDCAFRIHNAWVTMLADPGKYLRRCMMERTGIPEDELVFETHDEGHISYLAKIRNTQRIHANRDFEEHYLSFGVRSIPIR